jgi:hypothetical protein
MVSRTKASQMIEIVIVSGDMSVWRLLLWQGVMLEVEIGVSIQELLVGGLGIDEAYVKNRIRTVFLNGQPVDDLESAMVDEGSQIALGGSAPGIVGIAMRRESPVGSMREGITYQRSNAVAIRKRGQITVKLFGEVAEFAGPMVLKRGIIIDARVLNEFWADLTGVDRVDINGKISTLEEVKEQLSGCQDNTSMPVLLKVVTKEAKN